MGLKTGIDLAGFDHHHARVHSDGSAGNYRDGRSTGQAVELGQDQSRRSVCRHLLRIPQAFRQMGPSVLRRVADVDRRGRRDRLGMAIRQQLLARCAKGRLEGVTVFITGGTGVVGRPLLQRLVADGSNVRALARTDESAAWISSIGADPVHGDIDDVPALLSGKGPKRSFTSQASMQCALLILLPCTGPTLMGPATW